MMNIDEEDIEDIDSSSSTVDLSRHKDEIRNKLLQDTYYESLDLDNRSFHKCLQRNKLLLFSFLFSLIVGIIFLIIMIYR